MIEATNSTENLKYACVCCGYKTMYREDHLWEICPVCFWQSDPLENTDPDYKGGANKISLREAQQNFIVFGACEKCSILSVRKPNDDEPRDENFKLIDEQL
jgi:Cysteine-rich CPCC